MNINLAIGLFFIVTIVYCIIITVFSALLRIDGVPGYLVRFQVVSLLTNSGYTTSESEIMLANPRRRKLCSIIMLFGYIFSATFISLIVNIAISIPKTTLSHFNIYTVIIGVVFVAAIIILNLRKIKEGISAQIEKSYINHAKKHTENYINILDISEEYAVAKIYANSSGMFRDNLSVNILYLNGKISKEEKISWNAGDQLIVYGLQKDIYLLFA